MTAALLQNLKISAVISVVLFQTDMEDRHHQDHRSGVQICLLSNLNFNLYFNVNRY